MALLNVSEINESINILYIPTAFIVIGTSMFILHCIFHNIFANSESVCYSIRSIPRHFEEVV